jgi:DNA-binding PadR family transcriptional regulator
MGISFQTIDLFVLGDGKKSGMHDLTGFQRDALYVVAGLEDPKGLAIKEELDDYYGAEINHGRLYPNLDALVDKGLIEKGEKDDRTNEYSVTKRGSREIEARREWEAELVD